MQSTAIGTVAKSLPKNREILLNRLISNSYIPYTDLQKKSGITEENPQSLYALSPETNKAQGHFNIFLFYY